MQKKRYFTLEILPEYQKTMSASILRNPSLEEILAEVIANRNVFLHGPGGVGKSWLLRRVAKSLIDIGTKVAVTATTGVAAVGLSDPELGIVASTLHRFAGVGTASLGKKGLITKVSADYRASKRWKTCQVLIIDEVSMLGANLFEKLDAIARAIRSDDSPMGGIRMIFSGDFLQLPPVKDNWIFNSQIWKELNIRPFVLEVPHRYGDMEFFNLLLRVRKGLQTDDDCKILRARVRANQKMQDILANLNNVNPAEIIRPTMFFSKRVDVEAFNMRELEKLPGPETIFTAVDSFTVKKGNPNLDDYSRLLDDDMPRNVVLKVGAQVMLRVNLDTEAGLVNGSRAVVCEIIPGEGIIAKFLNGQRLRIDLQTRTLENKQIIANRTQIPFVLAYALTIHKAQSSTLDYIVVDLGPSVFADGQAYVALSRCSGLKGLFISEFTRNSIITNEDALRYAGYLEQKAILENEKPEQIQIRQNVESRSA